MAKKALKHSKRKYSAFHFIANLRASRRPKSPKRNSGPLKSHTRGRSMGKKVGFF